MGTFLLCRNSFRSDSTLNAIVRNEASSPVAKTHETYTLFIFKKQTLKEVQCFESKKSSIYGIGTFIYKGLPLEKILEVLLNEFENGRFDHSRLIGHYFIFIFRNGKLTVLHDGTSLIGAYHDVNGSFLTSSFNSASSILNKITLSRQTVIENLVTGGITGDDTLFNELKKFSKRSGKLFPDINFIYPTTDDSVKPINSRRQALQSQAEVINNYITDCKPLADKCGADMGLTGGFDSRLLLGSIINQFNDFQVHSHYRNQYSRDLDIARLITEKFHIPFVSPVVKPSVEHSDEELSYTLESSFNFYDAQIRMHCNWNEEYNTLEYRLKVLNGKTLGFHGIGGEQYRNAERICLSSWNYRNWIKYNIVRRTGGNVFKEQSSESVLIEKLQTSINEQLGNYVVKNRISIGELKRINNEVFIPSFRGARTSAENRISFFLSPFADFHVSASAYTIIPFLDCTNNFEIDLIRMISPDLAGFQTNYGYSLNKREPFRKYFTDTVFENLVPSSTNWYTREMVKHRKQTNALNYKGQALSVVEKYLRNVRELDLPVNTDILLDRPDTAPLVLSMGYFLEKFKNRLS